MRKAGASSTAGRTFYEDNCLACHGEPDQDFNGANGGKPEGGIAAYLQGDGKLREFVHKARWGIPDTTMTRSAIGTLTFDFTSCYAGHVWGTPTAINGSDSCQ